MLSKNPKLSVIIPVFNEATRIFYLKEAIKYFQNHPTKAEIIIVNDGSTDNTLREINTLSKKNSLIILSYKGNRGKGYAIKQGMLNAKGDFLLFMDIDLSTPLAEINKFLPKLKNYDLVIGTRKHREANLIARQPVIRESLGKVFTFISQVFLGVYVSDFTCGFKLFSKTASKRIFKKAQVNRWGFDSEILFLAKKYGFKICEIPVTWRNDSQTKVKFPQDIFNSFGELLEIRKNNLLGKY